MTTQLSLFNTMTVNSGFKTEMYIDQRTNDLWEEAKRLFNDGFAILSVNAADVPDELLGEVVELLDFCYPEECKEPLFDVSGIDHPIPMSALTVA